MKYALDTNIHIAAFRDSTGQKAAEIQEFSAAYSTSIYFCSVVALEFLVGIHPDDFKDVYREVVQPFEKTERVIYPSHQAYILAARPCPA